MTENRAAPGFYIRVGPPAPGAGGRANASTQLDESARVVDFKFEDDEQKPDKLTLVVDNHDLRHIDSDTWAKGNVIEFSFGYEGRRSPPRTAVVQTVKGFEKLTIEALSSDCIMNRSPRPDRVFENVKRSEVVRLILKEYGYDEKDMQIEDTERVLEQVTQGPFTDYQLIRQLASKEGFEFYVDFDGVHFHKRRLDQKPIKAYTYFTEQGRGEMLGAPSIEDSIAPEQRKVGAITMRGRDPSTGKPFEVRADNATVQGRPTLMPTMTVHEQALTDQAKALAGNGVEVVSATTEDTEEGAKRQAEAYFAKHQMRAVKMSFAAVGDPNMVAKSVIRVDGIGQRLSGLYYVRNVIHQIAPASPVYKMMLKVSTDGQNAGGTATVGAPPAPAANGTQNPDAGTNATADPHTLQRVRVLGVDGSHTEDREIDTRGRSGGAGSK